MVHISPDTKVQGFLKHTIKLGRCTHIQGIDSISSKGIESKQKTVRLQQLPV